MKVAIEQEVLKTALEKGALASFSEEAKSETSSVAALIKSVKISVDENLIIESATQLLGSRFTIPAIKENGIEVKDKGLVMVPARELYEWVSRQQKSKILLSLKELDVPEAINTNEEDEADGITKIGTLQLVSKDDSKTGAKWALDCYDERQISLVDFTQKPQTLFDVETKTLKNALKAISFSASPKDDRHIWDSISFQPKDNKVYMLATDCTRLAVYHLDVANNILENNLLLPCNTLSAVIKNIDDIKILSIAYNAEESKVYLSTIDMDIRFTIPDVSSIEKFPPVSTILDKFYESYAKINKKILNQRLLSVSVAKNANALFTFSDETLTIHVISESGYKPSIATLPIKKVNSELKVVFSIKHILDILKTITDDFINIDIPEAKNSAKLSTDDNKKASYYIMTVNTPLYNTEKNI